MIQRIQTLYLLIITVLSVILLFNPVAGLINSTDAVNYLLNFKGLVQVNANSNEVLASIWSLNTIALIIPLISLLTIFLYKKRILQIRLSFINIVLMAGYYGILFIYLWQYGKELNADWYLKSISSFHLINIILCFLAIRSIGKDEALVKSLNRIR